MTKTRSWKFGALAVVLVAGCHAAPKTKPQILGSYAPPGSPQAPPLNSRQPIDVPSAPVMQPRPAAAIVTPAPALQVGPPPAGYLVPAQPPQQLPAQPQAQQQQQQQQLPQYPELQPRPANPANPQQQNSQPPNATRQQPKTNYDNRPLDPPEPRG